MFLNYLTGTKSELAVRVYVVIVCEALRLRNELYAKGHYPSHWLVSLALPEAFTYSKRKDNSLRACARSTIDRKVRYLSVYLSNFDSEAAALAELKSKYTHWCLHHNKIAFLYNKVRQEKLLALAAQELDELTPVLSEFVGFDKDLWNNVAEKVPEPKRKKSRSKRKKATRTVSKAKATKRKAATTQSPSVAAEPKSHSDAVESPPQTSKKERAVALEKLLGVCRECGNKPLFEHRFIRARATWFYEISCPNGCWPKVKGFVDKEEELSIPIIEMCTNKLTN